VKSVVADCGAFATGNGKTVTFLKNGVLDPIWKTLLPFSFMLCIKCTYFDERKITQPFFLRKPILKRCFSRICDCGTLLVSIQRPFCFRFSSKNISVDVGR